MRIETKDFVDKILNIQQTPPQHTRSQIATSLENEMFPQMDHEDLSQVVDQFNDFLKPLRTNLKFTLHDKLDKYYVEIVDPLTKETLREIPPKEMLDMYAARAEFMGILVDHKI